MLNRDEIKEIKAITSKPYMQKAITLVEAFVKNHSNNCIKTNFIMVFDEIFHILNEARPFVEKYLSLRKQQGEIRDEKQSLKSIAGNSFSLILMYIFLKNKELGNIKPNIFITNKVSKVPSFEDISTINVDGETQKPDCDIVIYSLNKNGSFKKCMILSLKTSLRERAGQTYKWKLLMEIATSDNSIKEKYNIVYKAAKMPLVAFATVNFYNEINNPQHKGMFKFFDKSFIAKNVDADFISRMSTLPQYVNQNL